MCKVPAVSEESILDTGRPTQPEISEVHFNDDIERKSRSCTE